MNVSMTKFPIFIVVKVIWISKYMAIHHAKIKNAEKVTQISSIYIYFLNNKSNRYRDEN